MIRELTPELAKIAQDELHENPKQIHNDLHQIKEWISKQSHLKARTDDQWLVAILRGSKFSLEKAKRKLELYYILRTTAPDITLKLRPTKAEFINFLKLGTCVILPKPKTGVFPRVVLLRPGAYDPQEHSLADLMCVFYYLVQILVVEDDVATVLGTKIVVDYEGVTMNHVAQANPTMAKKMISVCQESIPLRLKGSHHINLPMGAEVLFSVVSRFLNEKAKERLKIHKTSEELLEFLPKEIIPVNYGGTGGTIKDTVDHWVKKVREYKTWMQKEETLGTDESKRYNMPTGANDIDGSFRKLDID